MSRAEPMPLTRRLAAYLGYSEEGICWSYFSDRDLTPAQPRRAWHKAHRNHERGGPGKGEELYGRKGRPTPRRAEARAARLARRREAEAARG